MQLNLADYEPSHDTASCIQGPGYVQDPPFNTYPIFPWLIQKSVFMLLGSFAGRRHCVRGFVHTQHDQANSGDRIGAELPSTGKLHEHATCIFTRYVHTLLAMQCRHGMHAHRTQEILSPFSHNVEMYCDGGKATAQRGKDDGTARYHAALYGNATSLLYQIATPAYRHWESGQTLAVKLHAVSIDHACSRS
jgi:hypothetical protein